ncbi:Mur ligase [Podospora fimiseda]|uniref:Folylpolyglutamate synthase n=1 Tax=Podospora fimiseda TaxID=252190 RepID=A0AAN7BXY6_9PEZI|nr:Mur ligase [Podospora fimiseda]
MRSIYTRITPTPTNLRSLTISGFLVRPSTSTSISLQHRRHYTTTKMSTPYDQALSRLSSLQSNSLITSLFDSLPSDSQKDINSLAIPEMKAWMSRAGVTPELISQSGLKCVHVAGTKGKGSVSAYIASIIQQYFPEEKVGLYTSPHLVSVRERIMLGGKEVDREVFARYVELVWKELTETAKKLDGGRLTEEECEGPGTKPFYFRYLTIVAMKMFLGEGVKNAVIECGIGGEYDSTNVLEEGSVTAAVVTQLGIDHVGMLGDTVEKIAWHKSGIFKRGIKGFTLREGKEEGVRRVLRSRAEERGLEELVEVEVEEGWEGVEGGKMEGGPFVKGNMTLAVYAAREHLRKCGVEFEGKFGREGEWGMGDLPEEFLRGLREARLRGRSEVVRDREVEGLEWCVDGAHTEDSLAGVGEWFAGRVKEEEGLRVLVFNQQDRDPSLLLKALLGGVRKVFGEGKRVFTHAVFTRNEEKPAVEGEKRNLTVQRKAEETMKEFDSETETKVYSDVGSAVEQVRLLAAEAKKEGKSCKVLATGSFHLLGAVLIEIDNVAY